MMPSLASEALVIHSRLRNDLYCVGSGVKLYSLTLVIQRQFNKKKQLSQSANN